MHKVQVYEKVRRACYVEQNSQREAARAYGINRRSVKKMMDHSVPPGYRRQSGPVCPKLTAHKEWIESVLKADQGVHPKQRHTAKRIFERLRKERAFEGGYTIVREFVAKCKKRSQEMYVPLEHTPGMAQYDFGEATVLIANEEMKAHFCAIQLPFSDSLFVKAYPAENTESFQDAHISAFKFFGGVPKRILYDNTTIAVKRIERDGRRQETDSFIALKSHYLFESVFAAPAKGNEKGNVEGAIKYARRNFMVPQPAFESFEAFNDYLESCCRQEQGKVKRGQNLSVSDRLKNEEFLTLPSAAFEAVRVQSATVNAYSLVRFQNNDYSVPTKIGRQNILIRGSVNRVQILYNNQVVADHQRLYGKEKVQYDPLHYLPLIERKIRSFDQAAPLKNWSLPKIFQTVERILYERDGTKGRRQYIRILMLRKTYSADALKRALEEAHRLGALEESAIVHILRRQLEGKPIAISLADHPAIPHVHVPCPDLQAYALLNRSSEYVGAH